MTDLFFYSAQQKKTYKLSTTKNGTLMYWICVCKTEGGGFLHARGADPIESMEKGKEILTAIGVQVGESDYINALKDYFAIDKKVREAFIQTYKL